MRSTRLGLLVGLLVAATLAGGCQGSAPAVPLPSTSSTVSAFPPGETLTPAIPDDARFVVPLALSRRIVYAPADARATPLYLLQVGKRVDRLGEIPAPIDQLCWSGSGGSLLYTEQDPSYPDGHQLGEMRVSLIQSHRSTRMRYEQPLRLLAAPLGHTVFGLLGQGAATQLINVTVLGGQAGIAEAHRAELASWSLDGRRLAYVSEAGAPAGQRAIWTWRESDGAQTRLGIAPEVEGLFWRAGDRLAGWTRRVVDGKDAELIIHSFAADGSAPADVRIDLADATTGAIHRHSAITPTLDGSRLLMRRHAPDQTVLVSIAERRVVAVGPATGFHGWLDGDRYVASNVDGHGARYFLQPLPPPPPAPAVAGMPALDPLLPFSYEVADPPTNHTLHSWQVSGQGYAYFPGIVHVKLRDEGRLAALLEKYQATVERGAGFFAGGPSYTLRVAPSDDTDLSELQRLGSEADRRGHHRYSSRAAAVLDLIVLRLAADEQAGVEYATTASPVYLDGL